MLKKILILFLICLTALSWGADWSRWRGPGGNGVYSDNDWSSEVLEKEMKLLWKNDKLGTGFSAPSVKEGLLYIIGNTKNQDTVFCLKADTGKEVWRFSYPCRQGSYKGPRATPFIEGDVVYTTSREGEVFCFEGKSGKLIWRINVAKELGASPPGWGFAGSPIIEGNMLLLNANKWGVALNKKTGKTIWSSPKGTSGYASPVVYEYGKKKYVAVFSQWNLFGVELKTGKKAWEYSWTTSYDVNAADPLVVGNQIFISSGYGKGAALLELTGSGVKEIWKNRNLASHFSSFLYKDGYIYGSNGNSGSRGTLRCIEMKTGAIKWQAKLKPGSLLGAGDKIIYYSEYGDLFLAQWTHTEYKQLAAHKPIRSGSCWNAPVMSKGLLYLRDGRGRLYCYDARKK